MKDKASQIADEIIESLQPWQKKYAEEVIRSATEISAESGLPKMFG